MVFQCADITKKPLPDQFNLLILCVLVHLWEKKKKKNSLAHVLEDYNHNRYEANYHQGHYPFDPLTADTPFCKGKSAMIYDEGRDCLPQGPI